MPGWRRPVPDKKSGSREEILDDLRRCADPEYSGLAGLERAGALAERLSFRQQSATAPQQIFAFGGEPNAAARAVE